MEQPLTPHWHPPWPRAQPLSSLLTPTSKALRRTQPWTSTSSWRAARRGHFIFPANFNWRSMDLFCLFLYVMIKYRLSAQFIPEAKGKSLCPHIICKPSPSLRTDLFTGRKSALYYSVVTPPWLSSLFNVMPSHAYYPSRGLHISFLKGGRNIFEW